MALRLEGSQKKQHGPLEASVCRDIFDYGTCSKRSRFATMHFLDLEETILLISQAMGQSLGLLRAPLARP